MVLSGKYRNYCVVQAATRTSDSQGGWTVGWSTSFSDWFKVTPLSDSRALENGGIKYKKAARFECRYGSGISEANRITWNGDNYTIHSVVPDEKLLYNTILCYV
jgi:SPP1 family predicted phage head-tail adaptor